MISLIMKKIPAEKIFWQVFFLFCKVFEEGFRKRKASELSEKKHCEKCIERVLGSHCNYIVCMPEKNQKTFLKPIAL